MTNESTRILQAYLDGEMTAKEAARVEARLEHDTAWQCELAALERAWGLVDDLPQPRLEASLWPDLSSQLAGRKGSRQWTWPQRSLAAAAMAAGIVLGVGLADQAQPVTDVASSDIDIYSQDDLPTLDDLWFSLGTTDEDVES